MKLRRTKGTIATKGASQRDILTGTAILLNFDLGRNKENIIKIIITFALTLIIIAKVPEKNSERITWASRINKGPAIR